MKYKEIKKIILFIVMGVLLISIVASPLLKNIRRNIESTSKNQNYVVDYKNITFSAQAMNRMYVHSHDVKSKLLFKSGWFSKATKLVNIID